MYILKSIVAVLVLFAVLLIGAIAGVVLFSKIKLPGTTLDVKTESFRQYLVSAKSTPGDELIVAEIRDNIELAETSETKEYWTGLTMGKSSASIRAPVVYTYYINISGEWLVSVNEHFILAVAPPVRLLKPATIITTGIQKFVNDSWLSFDGQAVADRLVQKLTMMATQQGDSPAKISLARKYARKAIAEFVEKWVIQQNLRKKIIVIQFPEERIADTWEPF